MKIAVSSTGPSLEAQVDPRFGRAQFLVIVETDTLEFEAIENPNLMAGGGAGIQTAQMIAGKGATVVLTGNCGPNAYRALSAAGITVHVGVTGTVREGVERFKRGELESSAGPSVPGHFGLGQGVTGGAGSGRGPGMGGGGRGGGSARMGPGSASAGPSPAPTAFPGENLEALKQDAASMRTQLEQITKRLDDLEKR